MTTEREGRLLATMVNVLTAGMSDPSRLSRGRTYARQGAVLDLRVEGGELTASVQGSRSRPYDVTVHVAPAASFDTTAALVPSRRDLRFSCTCPDWEDPCKHAVAVMVAFAEHVGDQPEVLATWRGKPPTGDRTSRAVIGSRASTTGAGAVVASAAAALDQQTATALAEFLGTPVAPPADPAPVTEPLSSLRPPAAAWGELWAEMLTSALDVLTGRDDRS